MVPIERGSTYEFSAVHYHNDVATSLAGSTVQFIVKKQKEDSVLDDSSALIKVFGTLDSNQTGNPGLFSIVISPAQTQKTLAGAIMPLGKAYYSFKIKHADGKQLVEGEGSITISGSTTNGVLA